MYDLLLKGGEVIDPAQGIHEMRDVAIKDGKIATLEKNIGDSEANEVILIKEKLVVPGLIDLHCHPAVGLVAFGVPADEIGIDSGVTLLCDGGTSGAANFLTMRQFIMERARTDMFCFLNLASTGLLVMPEIRHDSDIDPQWSRAVIEDNSDVIKGVKICAISSLAESVGIKGVEIAKRLATDFQLPLVMHIGSGGDRDSNDIMDDFTRTAVGLMETGDILTHFMTWRAGGLILPTGTIYPELLEAQRRGVVLDSCHGFNNFSLIIAKHAIDQGLLPDVISTDMTSSSAEVVQSLMVTMSKFINLGLTVEQVVAMTTINPAKAIGEQARYGSLRPGISANVTVMEVVRGDYLFSDGNGRNGLEGNLLLEPRMVLKNGVLLPCQSRYMIPPIYKGIQKQVHYRKP